MPNSYAWLATTAYALESVTARELKALGAQNVTPQTTRVTFTGGMDMGAKANVWLRTAGHVRLVVGEFKAETFDELYEGVFALPWDSWITRGMAFPVTARAVNSALMSVPDIQAITKKAIAARLQRCYGQGWLQEQGTAAAVEAHIYKNTVCLSLDTTGDALHRRGYRKLNGPAALRETLAAALVLLTKWRGDRPLADPFCGTGTIPIEAAMIARNMAPGMNRAFAAEKWPWVDASLFNQARREARGSVTSGEISITGSDVDEESLSMAHYHARRAAVGGDIRFVKADIRKFTRSEPQGHIITNPPYGGRLGSCAQAEELYGIMGRQFSKLPGWGVHVLSAHSEFERYYASRAQKRRELRNGNIPCRYFEYF